VNKQYSEIKEYRELPNGMRLFIHPSDVNHVVALHIILPFASATETTQNAGLTAFALRMLRRGTQSKSALEFETALDDLGTELGIATGKTTCAITLHCTDDAIAESFGLLREMMTQPAYTTDEIERERRVTLAGLRKAEDNNMGKTMRMLCREMYPDSGFGLPVNGLEETVKALDGQSIINRGAAVLRAPQPIIVCIGNCDPEMVTQQCESLLVPEARQITKIPTPPLPQKDINVSFERQCRQSIVVIGWRVCSRLAPDYPAMRLASAVLGESMSSRLFLHLRDEQGLAYSTGTHVSAGKTHGEMLAHIATNPITREHARNEMLREIELLRNEPVSQEELDRARNYVIGRMLISSQSNLSRAARMAAYINLGLGITGEQEYLQALRRVTPQEVCDAAGKWLTTPVCAELIALENGETATNDKQQ